MSAKAILSASVSAAPVYVEDVFSTFLYTGTGAAQTITNGIDLAGKGGLVWLKDRSNAADHVLHDTVRGNTKILNTNSTAGQDTASAGTNITAFNSNGFSLGTNYSNINTSSQTYVSWTFREAPKFFDVVTYTGTGSNTTIAHNLGSVPGSIIVKRTDTTADWAVYHRSLANTQYLVLNTTAAAATGATWWNSTTPTSSVFSVGTDASVNASGGTYVAYLFAHDAGGFGTAGTDNVIKCGTFTTDGTGLFDVNLGWEPQWLLAKESGGSGGQWYMADTMRGFGVTQFNTLRANSSNAESVGSTESFCTPYASGFRNTSSFFGPNATMIYIAIRRGPMKTPTVGTSVYVPTTRTGNASTNTVTGLGFPPDLVWTGTRNASEGAYMFDKLRGPLLGLRNFGTDGEVNDPDYLQVFSQDGYTYGSNSSVNGSSRTYIDWGLRRAPGFFDVVAYTGTGSNTTQAHNLGVVPELIIVKQRSAINPWRVYSAPTAATTHLALNTDAAITTSSANWNDTSPTSSVFTVGTGTGVNGSGGTYIAYLFATVAGVSKVGSYTGTGTTKQIDCGFTAGARFVLIKRTDTTGDWYVWDTARGIISGNDPYLLLNSSAAENTSTDYIDPLSSGFEISSTAPAAINANGGSFIFLAIS